MTNRIIIGLAVVATSLLSCTQKEPLSPEQGANGSLVITAGFEQQFPEGGAAVDSKTYLAGGSEIRWSSNAIDKVIYVFDSDGQKNRKAQYYA